MSLYQLQKLLYQVTRDDRIRRAFLAAPETAVAEFDLAPDEAQAVLCDDIGYLYILGVNGQILLHYATWRGFSWDRYLQALREALATHGQVRSGLYATVSAPEGVSS